MKKTRKRGVRRLCSQFLSRGGVVVVTFRLLLRAWLMHICTSMHTMQACPFWSNQGYESVIDKTDVPGSGVAKRGRGGEEYYTGNGSSTSTNGALYGGGGRYQTAGGRVPQYTTVSEKAMFCLRNNRTE